MRKQLRISHIEDIYDGVVVYPTEIICEMTPSEYEDFLAFVEQY